MRSYPSWGIYTDRSESNPVRRRLPSQTPLSESPTGATRRRRRPRDYGGVGDGCELCLVLVLIEWNRPDPDVIQRGALRDAERRAVGAACARGARAGRPFHLGPRTGRSLSPAGDCYGFARTSMTKVPPLASRAIWARRSFVAAWSAPVTLNLLSVIADRTAGASSTSLPNTIAICLSGGRANETFCEVRLAHTRPGRSRRPSQRRPRLPYEVLERGRHHRGRPPFSISCLIVPIRLSNSRDG
jgi:hypothetical protein